MNLRATIALAMLLSATVACTCRAETAADIPEAQFDKRGDLDLPVGSKQWVSYKDFTFLVMPPGNLLLKDPQNRFEPFSEKRQQLRGDDANKIESDKDLMKRMSEHAKEAVKATEKDREAREKAEKEQAKAEKKAQEKREKIERQAAEKEQERLEAERAAREGYPVRTESGWPVYFDFGVGFYFGSGHRHGRCR